MRKLLACLPFVLLFACNRQSVEIESTNAKGEVPRLGNLYFRFSDALAPDSLLNVWDSAAYVSFTPSIRGRFRWEQPDKLIFSPAEPLPPATTFKAEINDEALAHSRFGRIDNASDITFRTPDLKLEDMSVSWVLRDNTPNSATPRLDLYFNYKVSPEQVVNRLKITTAGKAVGLKVLTLSDDSRVSLLLEGIVLVDQPVDAEMTIGAGLLPEGGKNPIANDLNAPFVIPSPFHLAINDIVAEHDGLAGTVLVQTSQGVVMNDLTSKIKINPAVRFTVEQTDEGFAIKSDLFNADKTYQLTFEKGLRGVVGGTLKEQQENNIAFGELEPSLRFATNKSVYLSSAGNRMIELRIVNVPKVKVIVSKIYESNLLTATRYGYYPRDSRSGTSEDGYYYDDGYGNDLVLGDVVHEEMIDTRTLPKMGNGRLLTFNVEDRLPDFNGIYHIMVRSAEHYWVADSRFISMTDIGLIAREARDGLTVFASSITSAAPLQDVNVIAYGSNNQVLGMASTNADGAAEINFTRREFAGFKPAMIIAKTGDDFNYMPLNSTRVNMSRFETGGKRINSSGLDAFIYPERDIYRPGEQINFSVIVRNAKWENPGMIPLKMKFLLPNGKELRSFRKTLNEQGSLEGNLGLSHAAITGSYTLEVYASNDVLLGSRNFSIEEFVPDRIRLTSMIDKPVLMPGQSANISVNAMNFFGPPAAGRNYEMEIQVRAVGFRAAKYPAYDFSILNQGISMDKVVRQGKTDEQGNASEHYDIPETFRNNGQLRASIYTTVFDETGRPVSRVTQADIYTQPVFFGIGDDGYWYHALNQPVRFPLIALDRNQKLLSGAKAMVKVIRREYRTVLSKSGGYFRYESQQDDKLVSEQTVTVSGEGTAFTFIPRVAGNYEIRISPEGAAGYVSRTFYSYGNWGMDNYSFEVDTDGNIDIETDKSVYAPGETAKILLKAPFNGRVLLTVESDKLLSYQYLDVEKRVATTELEITAEHLPNIFITATLVKPHSISDIPLTVAHGFQNLTVAESSRINKVEIVSAKASRSKTRQRVTVKAAPGSYVTLAAVDNGVLQVTNFKTPDPYGYFYAQRALGVAAYDLYPYLFPEARARLSSTGGDGDQESAKRVNPMPSKRVSIMSYWSGIVKANGNGQAEFEVPLPAFSGQVRLMAVAYKNQTFGSAESQMTVADPLVISTALPRFLSPGDSISVPVTISNTTGTGADAVASIRATGPMNISGNMRQSLKVLPNTEGRVVFGLVAGQFIDTGRIVVEVTGLGEKFREEIAMSIRPASPLQVVTGSGSVEAGSSAAIAIGETDFIPGTSKRMLVLSRSPVLESGRQLQFLANYPYGCTEQIISSAFPQLYYGYLAEQMVRARGSDAAGNSNRNVMEAIRLIRLRQLYNGALTLWEREGTEHWWTTVYAAHFLIEAQKAGFDVDKSLLDGMLGYLNNRLRNKQTITYYYNGNQQRKIAPKEVAYTLYVLALAGRPNAAAMNYYKANTSLLSLDARYLLSVAYAISGDRKRFGEMLPVSFSGEVSVQQTGGSFYSPIRDEAIALNALIDADPANAQIPLMARHVMDQLKTRDWYNTQESAFSFLALGKLSRSASASTATAEINVNGKVAARFEGKDLRLEGAQLSTEDIQVSARGKGRLYYYWQAEGVSASGAYREEDSYIRVRRQFFDRDGRKIQGNVFRQNDLIVVQVTMERLFGGEVENVAMTDILPAGFEVENPRTKEIPGMDWIKDAAEPVALDVRDDRVNIFADLKANRQVYYYAVRAVSPGRFRIGPMAADAMYNGEYHSYHGGGTIEVVESR